MLKKIGKKSFQLEKKVIRRRYYFMKKNISYDVKAIGLYFKFGNAFKLFLTYIKIDDI